MKQGCVFVPTHFGIFKIATVLPRHAFSAWQRRSIYTLGQLENVSTYMWMVEGKGNPDDATIAVHTEEDLQLLTEGRGVGAIPGWKFAPSEVNATPEFPLSIFPMGAGKVFMDTLSNIIYFVFTLFGGGQGEGTCSCLEIGL